MGIEYNPEITGGDLLTGISLLLVLVGGWFSLRRFRIAVKQQSRAVRLTHYSELDRFYFDILSQAIAHPHLRASKLLASDDEALCGKYEPFDRDSVERLQYDTYAQMVWCFVETVHDRCRECEDEDDRKSLIETWATAIEVENRLHRGWFLAEIHNASERENSKFQAAHPFREGFRSFIMDRKWREPDWKDHT